MSTSPCMPNPPHAWQSTPVADKGAASPTVTDTYASNVSFANFVQRIPYPFWLAKGITRSYHHSPPDSRDGVSRRISRSDAFRTARGGPHFFLFVPMPKTAGSAQSAQCDSTIEHRAPGSIRYRVRCLKGACGRCRCLTRCNRRRADLPNRAPALLQGRRAAVG